MSSCSIIIKIKDYFPKVDSIPYKNFICLFTCGENEGQLPLISQETENIQHQLKNITSDIKYKIHVLDYNDMSLIGMCEMIIPYNIISQIKPPNGFIQEQQKKLLIDVNTKRRLFGTVLNMGDIYLNIYSEIYLSEKNSITNIKSNKSVKRKKILSPNNKKIDGSPKTVHKKKLIMKMNSDRQALINLNKNNLCSLEIPQNNNFNSNRKHEKNGNSNNVIKPNNSFNYKEIKLNKNGILTNDKINNISLRENKNKQKSRDNIIKKSKDKKNYINNNKENKNNAYKNNLLNRIIKTETNKNYKNEIHENKKINKLNKGNKQQHKQNNILENEKNKYDYNIKTENKIPTIENLDSISIPKSNKNYIKKNNIPSPKVNNALFLNNPEDRELHDIDEKISLKNLEIKKDYNNLKFKNEENAQIEVKNNIIKILEFYFLINQKLLKVHKKNTVLNKKFNMYKENLLNELKKNNKLTQKKTNEEIEKFVNINVNGAVNEKFIREMIKLKKSEFKIYQNIFNLFYYDYDVLKWKEQEKNKKMEESVKVDLLLVVFKNLIKNYGNVSQIFMDDLQKQSILKKCLNKYNLVEKNENEVNNNSEKQQNKEQISNNNIIDDKDNKNEIEKFRVINEVDEEKEDENEEEYNYNNNQISFGNSNIKADSQFNSNKKLKSFNKNKQNNVSTDENKNINIKNLNDDIVYNNPEENKNLNGKNLFKEVDENNINNVFKEKDEDNKLNKEIDNDIHNNEVEQSDKKIINEKLINTDKNDIKKENYLKDDEENEQNISNDKYVKISNIINNEVNNNQNQVINEIINNNIESEKEEIKSIKNEKKGNNEYCNTNGTEKEKDNIKEEEKIINTNKNKIYKKNKIKKEKKEIYDKEDLIIQKQLIEEFPKKCKEENIFIRITKYEYSFGEEKIKVALEGDEVILKLDEGDYKLQEFIEILNEGKDEENEDNENINEVNEDKENTNEEENENNSSQNRKESNCSESTEKKNKRKRRKRVNAEESQEENDEKEIDDNRINKYENKENFDANYKENYYNYENKRNEDKKDNKYSDNKNLNYSRKNRRDYKF